jgi:serine/threonine-protein kinase ULK4
MNNYHLYEEIGRGKHCIVYKGRLRGSIQYVAIKSVDKSKRSRVLNEVSISTSLLRDSSAEPYIAELKHWYETRNHLWIVAEYCAGGDLGRCLKQDEKIVPESQIMEFSSQIVSGLLCMHAQGVIYADLKPSNVLFTESGAIKLSGFSVSQRVSELETFFSENRQVPRRGSPFYMAPELFREDGSHSFASDIWALGAVIFEMVTGRSPFGFCRSFTELQKHVLSSSHSPELESGSEELKHLVARMLAKNPIERIRWKELVSHPWWTGQQDWWLLDSVSSSIAQYEDRLASLSKY